MAFQILTDEELKELGFASQEDFRLCNKTGDIIDNKWRFQEYYFNQTNTQIGSKYQNIDSLEVIYTLSSLEPIGNDFRWTSFKFHKEI